MFEQSVCTELINTFECKWTFLNEIPLWDHETDYDDKAG